MYFCGCLYRHDVPSISYMSILYIAMSSTRHLVSWYQILGTCTSGMKYTAPFIWVKASTYEVTSVTSGALVPGTRYQALRTRYIPPDICHLVPHTSHQAPCTRYQVSSTRYLVPSTRRQLPGTTQNRASPNRIEWENLSTHLLVFDPKIEQKSNE